MLGLLAKSREKSQTTPRALYNVNISLTGWKGPFPSLNHFHLISRLVDKLIDLEGEFHVLETGELVYYKQKGLHTYFGELDVEVIGHSPHVHFKGGGLHYITRKDNRIFFEDIVSSYRNRKELGMEPRSPRYTLQGIYGTVPNNKLNTKIRALRDALKEHVDYDFNSISTHKETKVKLLENVYRRLVSNQ